MDSRPAEADELQEYIYALAADADFGTSGVCFAADSLGLRRSEDGGATWHPALDSLGLDVPLPASCVALSPHFQSDGIVLAGLPGGIARSEDRGATWSALALPEPPPFVSSLALSPNFAHDRAAFAATMEDGVFLSSDGGQRWAAWNIGLLDHRVLCIAVSPAFAHDRLVFVGTESGIFSSANGGHFWQETAFPIDAAPVLSLALSPAFAQDGLIFAGTAAHGLLCSEDRGQSWQPRPIAGDGGAVNAVLVDPRFPDQPRLLALLEDTPYLSNDRGRSWAAALAAGQRGAGVSAIAAPLGLGPGCTLLAGLLGGHVARYRLAG